MQSLAIVVGEDIVCIKELVIPQGGCSTQLSISSGTECKGNVGSPYCVLTATKLLRADTRGTIKGTGNICPKDMTKEASGLYIGAFKPPSLSERKELPRKVAALAASSETSQVVCLPR